MKKIFSFVFMLVFICSLIALSPGNATAFGVMPTTIPQTKAWEWYAEGVKGEVVPMYKITTTPREWYQLKSDGIKVDGATKICHPFDEGRFGWTGEIFQLVEGAWVKLATTVGWVPDKEGKFKACAQAPAAGTYALFAYFDKAKAPVVECKYDTSAWSIGLDVDEGGDYFYASVDNLPFGTFVSYVLVGMTPPGSITGAMSGSGTVGNKYPLSGDVDFLGYYVEIDDLTESFTIRISAAGCVRIITETRDISD